MTKATKINPFANVNNALTPESARELGLESSKFKTSYLTPIKTTGKKLRDLVQAAGIYAMLRALGNENYDYFNQLHSCVESNLSKSEAKKLKIWAETYAPVKLTKVENGFSFRKDKTDSANPFDFEGAMKNPWWEIELHTIGEVAKMFGLDNIDNSIKSLVKRAEKALENDNVSDDEADQIKTKIEMLKAVMVGVEPNTTVTSANGNETTVIAKEAA